MSLSDPLVITVTNTTPIREFRARRELIEQWAEAYGAEPFEIVSRRGFMLEHGSVVCILMAKSILPKHVKWEP